MSILIKGIDKPTDCFFCPFKNLTVEPFVLCYKDKCPVIKVDKDSPIDDELIKASVEFALGELRYCDRNICTENEYNGVSCDECEVAKYYNIEDDDSPCLNCERKE